MIHCRDQPRPDAWTCPPHSVLPTTPARRSSCKIRPLHAQPLSLLNASANRAFFTSPSLRTQRIARTTTSSSLHSLTLKKNEEYGITPDAPVMIGAADIHNAEGRRESVPVASPGAQG